MQYYEDFNIGNPQESQSYTVEKEDIIAFASQWDPQPFHIDEEAAKNWPMGLIASSIHTFAISMKLCMSISTEPMATIAGLGIDEMRMTAPVKPGDQLRVRVWVENMRESKTKPDRGITTTRIEVLNQEDIVVLSYTNTGMILKRPLDIVTVG